jgi:hypothetical protein
MVSLNSSSNTISPTIGTTVCLLKSSVENATNCCKQEVIKAVVTWRAKDKDRLREKIYKRAYARPNGVGSLEEIKSDHCCPVD